MTEAITQRDYDSLIEAKKPIMVPVEYIGRKPFAVDNVAKSGKTWNGHGDVQTVTLEQAAILFQYQDQWRLAERQADLTPGLGPVLNPPSPNPPLLNVVPATSTQQDVSALPAAGQPAQEKAIAQAYADMTDDELRGAYATAIGRAPHPSTLRETLIDRLVQAAAG